MNEYATTDTCGCCQGEAPAPILYNRPGQSSLAYRIRTYADALEAMRSTLARPYLNVYTGRTDDEGRREADCIKLAQGLTTRADDDPAQALLDAWAAAVDVLTFYQERIANEGFLRTATERRSVLELARAIGYELSPTVAASTHLAFTVETAAGAPAETLVDAGTRVMSIPGQDELPQTFETSAAITARAAWNSLRPQLSERYQLELGLDTLYFRGVDVRLEQGDALLLIGDERLNDTGQKDDNRWDFRLAEAVTRVTLPDPARSYTVVKVKPLGEEVTFGKGQKRTTTPSTEGTRAYVLRARAALFGHNAPDWLPLSHTTHRAYLAKHDRETGDATLSDYKDEDATTWGTEWPDFTLSKAGQQMLDLDRPYPRVLPGSWLILQKTDYVEVYHVQAVTTVARSDYLLTGQVTRVALDTSLGLSEFKLRETAAYVEPEELFFAERPLTAPLYGHTIIIGGVQPDLARGQPLALSGKRQRVRVISALTMNLDTPDAAGYDERDLRAGDSLQLLAPPTIPSTDEPLTPAQLVKWLADADKDIGWRLQDRDGATGTLRSNGAWITLAPALAGDPTLSEVVSIADSVDAVTLSRDHTTLLLRDALAACYDRTTVTLNANTVHATHGATVSGEVLGSGDAGKPNQRFWLKKPPLTYLSAATPGGILSTLELRVNHVLWQELPSLYGLTPRDQAYTVRIEDDGKTAVIFGDGRQGARPPSGSENIVATYRTGGGPEGEVEAGQLSLLQTRPLGIRAVTNPAPARGAAPAEKMEDARRNAPNTVLTLDRIVSLRDYEDFARGFPGIGKARVDRLWTGRDFLIHVSAATARGEPLAPGNLYNSLVKAINGARDPQEALIVSGYVPVLFRLEADVLIDTPRYVAENVLADVRSLLDETFSFGRRDFGQPVTLAEVVTTIQQVMGVIAVDMVSLVRPLSAVTMSRGAASPTPLNASKIAARPERIRVEARRTPGRGVTRAVAVDVSRGRAQVIRRGQTQTVSRGPAQGITDYRQSKAKVRIVHERGQITPIPYKRTQIAGRSSAGAEPPAVLTAQSATYDLATKQVVLAELLLLDPDGVVLQEMSA